jgi:hypothetical protein
MADGTSSCVKGWLAKCACRLRQGLVPAMIKTRLATMNVNGAGIWWIRLEYRDRLLGRWSSRLFTAAARQGIGNEKGLGPARAHSATVAAAARWLNGKALSPSPDRGCSTAACKVSRLSRRFSAGFGHPRPVAGSNVPETFPHDPCIASGGQLRNRRTAMPHTGGCTCSCFGYLSHHPALMSLRPI